MNQKGKSNNSQGGWKHQELKTNLIIGSNDNPTKFKSGETIINKKSTKKNLKKLIEINNDVNPDVSNGKTTTDAKAGGLLKGKPHYDNNGNPTGGIPGVVDGQKPIETEGEEFVVNAEASKKHWKELSQINQQDGNGVPIGPPTESFDEDPAEEFENGGKIQFNPNYLPSKWIMSYAKKIKSKHPEIWKLGGNIFGNEAFENLKRVSERGYWLDSEEWMYVKWRSYVARHKQDFRIEGVVAMLKWVDKVDKGWSYMKSLIEEEIKKKSPKKMKNGGEVSDFGKVSSASGRFKPTETIVFDPPLIGINGNKLISYTWKYEWTTDFSIKTGDAIEKRVSDWTQAELSADTGRNIVHSFTVIKPDGTIQSVSSESVPVLMGFVTKEQKKEFANLATASKTLAKQQMQLSILEAQQKEYEEIKKSIMDAGYPEISIAPSRFRDNVTLIMGSGSVQADSNNPFEKERIEALQDSYVRSKMQELGINPYSGISYQIQELKKRIARQKRKVENITDINKMNDGGNIDYDVNDLLGRFVNIFTMGVSEPDYFKIKEVKISPEQYRYRDVTLRGDVGVTKFPLDKLDDFIAGKQILIQDNNEDYAIALTNERLASGGSTKNYVSYKDKYNRKYNYPKNESHSLEDISKDTGVSMKGLQKIFNKGIGAHKTNPESVRPNVKAKEQWAMARVYSAVMGGKASVVDANELKMAEGGEVGQEIICLNCGWEWNTNKSEEFDKYVCHNCGTDNSMTYAPKKHNEGGNVDSQDTVTMNIPLLIRTLELAREDVHSDAELHFVVENLLNIKNKKVLTMDDYAYIADIEHKHVNKLENGGNISTNKKEVSIGFGGLGNGTTVWDRNRIKNADYKIIAHISDFGKITYYDTKLPEYAISKIEAFAEQEKQRLAEGGELSQGYDFSPIQTPLN